MDVINLDLNNSIQSNNVEESFSKLYTPLEELLTIYAPPRKVTSKEYKLRCKPWITRASVALKRGRDSILNKAKKTKNPDEKN